MTQKPRVKAQTCNPSFSSSESHPRLQARTPLPLPGHFFVVVVVAHLSRGMIGVISSKSPECLSQSSLPFYREENEVPREWSEVVWWWLLSACLVQWSAHGTGCFSNSGKEIDSLLTALHLWVASLLALRRQLPVLGRGWKPS